MLNTARTSPLGPHTTTSLPCLWFHLGIQFALDFPVNPWHSLLHLMIWSQLSVSWMHSCSLSSPETFFQNLVLRRRQLRSYQNLSCNYKYLFQLDKEKRNIQIQLSRHRSELPWAVKGGANDCPATTLRRSLNRYYYNSKSNLYEN